MKHPGQCAPFFLHWFDLFLSSGGSPTILWQQVLQCHSVHFFFPPKPGAWLCHLCPLLPILRRIMNSHYIKLNGFLPCLLSIAAFHCRRVLSTCSHPIQQIPSHWVAQAAWPQASHPACWGTIHHTGGQDPDCFHLGWCLEERCWITASPQAKATHFRLLAPCLLTSACRNLLWFITLSTLSTAWCFQPACFLACAGRTKGCN